MRCKRGQNESKRINWTIKRIPRRG
jgi:hypothetical protein